MPSDPQFDPRLHKALQRRVRPAAHGPMPRLPAECSGRESIFAGVRPDLPVRST